MEVEMENGKWEMEKKVVLYGEVSFTVGSVHCYSIELSGVLICLSYVDR